MVRDMATTTSGKVRLSLLLAPDDPATLVRDVRIALERVEGVSEVRVDVKDPAEAAKSPPKSRSLPVMDDRPAAPRPSAPTPVTYPHLGRIIAVSSGKGGVGKSTVATNLAVALARAGNRVGLMDADIYGPNVPRMMGVDEPPAVVNEKIVPLEAFGVKVMSLGFMIDRDQPAIWRGPIVMKIITQFLRDVAWGDLDYFIVDMPPGTGDAQLTITQRVALAGGIVVTTPQEIALLDVRRGVAMFEQVEVPVLGVVENMSYHLCRKCGARHEIFGHGGGARLASELGVPFLGELPIVPELREGGDYARPLVAVRPDHPASAVFGSIAREIIGALDSNAS
jgi:ATP-binding protein involved in chromosome partitioning